MLFRDALATAIRAESPAFVDEMLSALRVERKAIEAFMAGKPTLTCSEVELLLTYLGYKLERVSYGK